MKINNFLFSTFAALCIVTSHEANGSETCSPQEDQDITISTKCASVLIVAGTTLGAGLTYALTPVAICAAGFCPAGVAGGSFASWWQSTMPLVAKGSLFAQLQALAMGGVGATTVTVGGGIIGGLAGAAYLSDFCAYVDEKDPDSVMGQAFDASEALVTTFIDTKIRLEGQCASSSTCTAMVETASETGTVVAKQISFWWNILSTSISNAATLTQLHMDVWQLQRIIRAQKEEFGVKAFDFLREVKEDYFTDVNLKKMYAPYLDQVRRLELQIKENQSNDGLAYTVRSLNSEINKQKGEFGIQIFDFLESENFIVEEWKSTELDTFWGMFQESLKIVNPIIVLLQEKQAKIDGF